MMSLKTYFPLSSHPDKRAFDAQLDALYQRTDMFSCISHVREGRYLHISPAFSLVGYPAYVLEEKGVDFFTQLAHRDDVLKVIEKEAEAFQKVFQPDFDPTLTNFTELTARVLQPDGNYIAFTSLVTVLEYFDDSTFKTALVAGYVPSDDSIWNKKIDQEARSILTRLKKLYRSIYTPSFHRASPASLTEIFNYQDAKHNLTEKEKEVIKWIAKGLSSRQIALQLNVSEATVETHRRNMFLKFGVNNVAELIKKASKIYWLE